jgi:methionine synthase II (cobalamin-independent)
MAQAHHSDVIGSLLRPRYLTEARDAYAGGQLDVITDGEFRRFSFLDQIVSEIDGVAPIEGAPVHFKSATEDWIWHNPFTVTGKISQRRKLTIEEFAYNRARARLGLVSSKTTTMEPVGDLTARIREAARYTGLERLGISTQCGFSSTLPGANLTTEDVQERKLELVAEVAAAVW